ncbi:RTA1 like protein family [Metarhizium rileyi]|uniref:RTA1 like protein family n=1 Tax=Metarhizium rileyi (strain RCEF 4871) TaxID=1649241 RepID=A0A162LYD1_METRR|nr:RTA1 like protein family [Metarhizium rileyi RCEF 4871]
MSSRTDLEKAQIFCRENPNNGLCDNVPGFYEYRLHLAPNAAFLGIFGASLVGHVLILIGTRRGVAFNVALILGLICEVLGYLGRILSWHNPWDENGFMIQICCLTIGPAFMAAGCYLCLRSIVSAFGPQNSRLPPESYTRIFIPCDVVSLVLQAVGGAMAATAAHKHDSAHLGSNIMIAGLAFQVATMLAFITASSDFALRTYRRYRAQGASALSQDPALVRMRSTLRFKLFLGALTLASVLILWRSAFRVAELSEGWTGPIMADQAMFVGFEGVLIVVAVLALNVFHPGICARELFEVGGGLTGCWCIRRKKGAATDDAKSLRDGESKPVPSDESVYASA